MDRNCNICKECGREIPAGDILCTGCNYQENVIDNDSIIVKESCLELEEN